MRLVHYSGHADPIEVRPATPSVIQVKPKGGFWVSDDTDFGWLDWCAQDDFGHDRNTYRREVVLDLDSPRVLVMGNAFSVKEFGRRYVVYRLDSPWNSIRHDINLNWRAVMEKYDAVIITPYQWSVRLDLMWYNGWDCASGVILHPDAIVAMGLPEKVEVTDLQPTP